ncbi:MAG TPA: heavy-metal-associated domain-containing protein [Chitinophagales bacterium]|nr:heavy-metal-associated domain-containing protein [Chitinophagales bacterium]
MNNLLFSALMLCLVACGTSQPATANKEKEVVIKTVIYCDHCAECEDCKPHIESATNAVKGVKRSKLDVESQTIKVVYDSDQTDEHTIRTAVSQAGFAADKMPPNPASYAKLDECCKKK